MAKQAEDKVTADLLGEPKKRGRPATGKALSGAERQRKRREEERNRGLAKDLTASGLLERMGGKGYSEEEKRDAWAEFGRRAGWSL